MFATHENRKVDSGNGYWSLVLFGFELRNGGVVPAYRLYCDGGIVRHSDMDEVPKHVKRHLLRRAIKLQTGVHRTAVAVACQFKRRPPHLLVLVLGESGTGLQ